MQKLLLISLLTALTVVSLVAQGNTSTLRTMGYTVQTTANPAQVNTSPQPPCHLTNSNNGYQCTYITGMSHNRVPIVASTYFLWKDSVVPGDDIVWRMYYQEVVFSTGRTHRYFTRDQRMSSRYIMKYGAGDDCNHYMLLAVDSLHLLLVCYSKLGDELWKTNISNAAQSRYGNSDYPVSFLYNLYIQNGHIRVVFHSDFDFETHTVYADVDPTKGTVERVQVMRMESQPEF